MKIDSNVSSAFSGQQLSENGPLLNIGDVFRAKIVDMSSSDVSLKLPNGSTMKATLQEPIDAEPGDFVDFKVKSLENNRVYVETVKDKITQNTKASEIDKALNSIGKEITPQNIETAKTLIDNNIKVTAESFKQLSDLVTAHKAQSLTAPKAFFLIQNNVSITPENIKLLDSFLNKKLNIVESFSEITSKLQNLNENQLKTLSSHLSLLEQFEELPKLIENFADTANKSGKTANIDSLIETEVLNISGKLSGQSVEKNNLVTLSNAKTTITPTTSGILSDSSQIDELLDFVNKMLDSKILNLLNTRSENNPSTQNALFNSAIDMLNGNNENLTPDKLRQSLINLFEEMPEQKITSEKNIITALKSSDNEILESFLSAGQDALNKLISKDPQIKLGTSPNANSLANLISENDLKNLFVNTFKDSLNKALINFKNQGFENNLAKEISTRIFDSCFVKVNENLSSKDIDVKEIYEKILRRLSIIDDVAKNSSSPQNNAVNTSISTIDKQIQFLNSVNSNQTYIQIPLIYDGNKNGELYIIKKKRSGNDNGASGTTVYLSLNTINIGRFETLVNVCDNKLKINIRLEKEDLIDFVKQNYPMLYNLLEKTKFKIVDIKCKKTDEELDPISVESVIKNEFTGNSKSIDFKV